MLKVNGDRLWQSLMAMAQIGPGEAGGSSRLALSAEDKEGRELFAGWCREVGMTVHVDVIGNLFARREGRRDGPPLVMGSHLDTQPRGGRFDGVYGVLAGLEVVRCLHEQDILTDKPLELAVWTNEEGARFTPAMLGSAVFTGALPLEEGLASRDRDGISVAEALAATGYAGELPLQRVFDSYFEAHIEQGPVLENDRLPIGVVTGGQAISWLDVRVHGQRAHAGTTPMPMRRDALFGTGQMLAALEQLAADLQGLVTVGQLSVAHSSRNTIAGDLQFTLDLRHVEDDVLATMEQEATRRMQAIADERDLQVSLERHWLSPATPFDPACVNAVREAVEDLGYAHRDIVSGAGHDAIHLARHCPTAMVFIPCAGGLSHNEAESITPEHARQGADVLLNAVVAHARTA